MAICILSCENHAGFISSSRPLVRSATVAARKNVMWSPAPRAQVTYVSGAASGCSLNLTAADSSPAPMAVRTVPMATAVRAMPDVMPSPHSPATPMKVQMRPHRQDRSPPPGASRTQTKSDPKAPPKLPAAMAQDFEQNLSEGLLGSGAFAQIFRVTQRGTGQPFAIKVMSRQHFAVRGIEKQIKSEVDAMSRAAETLRCRHIVKLCETYEENGSVFLRMELCKFSLLHYVNTQPGCYIPEHNMGTWARHLCLGLKDLHELCVMHRDIKPENLLISQDGALKIADFGWCAEIHEAPSSLAGTFQFMAPEVLEGERAQTEAVDVWSAGATLFQVLMAHPLLRTALQMGPTGFSATDPHKATKVRTSRLLGEIAGTCPLHRDSRPPHLSTSCWDFLRVLLIPDVATRATTIQALAHPWLVGSLSESESALLATRSGYTLQDAASNPLRSPVLSSTRRVNAPVQFKLGTSARMLSASTRSTSMGPLRGHPHDLKCGSERSGSSTALPSDSTPSLSLSEPSSTPVVPQATIVRASTTTQSRHSLPQQIVRDGCEHFKWALTDISETGCTTNMGQPVSPASVFKSAPLTCPTITATEGNATAGPTVRRTVIVAGGGKARRATVAPSAWH